MIIIRTTRLKTALKLNENGNLKCYMLKTSNCNSVKYVIGWFVEEIREQTCPVRFTVARGVFEVFCSCVVVSYYTVITDTT